MENNFNNELNKLINTLNDINKTNRWIAAGTIGTLYGYSYGGLIVNNLNELLELITDFKTKELKLSYINGKLILQLENFDCYPCRLELKILTDEGEREYNDWVNKKPNRSMDDEYDILCVLRKNDEYSKTPQQIQPMGFTSLA